MESSSDYRGFLLREEADDLTRKSLNPNNLSLKQKLSCERVRHPNVVYHGLTERFFLSLVSRGKLLAYQALAEIFHCQG